MERLKRRSDFRAAASAARTGVRAFALQARRRGDNDAVRVGFTVSRQVGNAVERNRVRRRLRELVRTKGASEPDAMRAGYDYVLIGRRAALTAPFADMIRDLNAALRRIHHSRQTPNAGGTAAKALHETGPQAAVPGKPSRPPRHES